MPLDFPNSPVLNDTYTPVGGNTYRYDGSRWIIVATPEKEAANIKILDTGFELTDAGPSGNVYILADGASVGYFDVTNGFTAIDSLFAVADSSDPTRLGKFNSASISTGTTRTFTIPDESGELLISTGSQIIANKSFDNTNTITVTDANLSIVDNADVTKVVTFQLSGITSGQTRTLTVPNSNGNLLLINNSDQTISNKVILLTNTLSAKSNSFTLVKSTNSLAQARFDLSQISTNQTRIYKLPDIPTAPGANTKIVSTDRIQTLTSKTINNVTLTGTTILNDAIIEKPKLLEHSVTTEALGTLTGTGTTNVNIANARYFTVTMTANARTFAFINPPPSGHAATFHMEITNGGQATITWPTGTKWSGQGGPLAPLLSLSGTDVLTFTTSDGGTAYRGSFAIRNSS